MIKKIRILIFALVLTSNFLHAPDYENYCLATTVQVIKHALKDRNPTQRKLFWIKERLKFLEECNNHPDLSSSHYRRQKYLAKRIKRLHPHQD